MSFRVILRPLRKTKQMPSLIVVYVYQVFWNIFLTGINTNVVLTNKMVALEEKGRCITIALIKKIYPLKSRTLTRQHDS